MKAFAGPGYVLVDKACGLSGSLIARLELEIRCEVP